MLLRGFADGGDGFRMKILDCLLNLRIHDSPARSARKEILVALYSCFGILRTVLHVKEKLDGMESEG